jgi:hypothetical protein
MILRMEPSLYVTARPALAPGAFDVGGL